MRLLIRAATLVTAAAFASLRPLPASADESHLPVITLSPVATWAIAQNALGSRANNAIEGPVELTGSASIPIYRGLSATYDRIAGGPIYFTFAGVTIGGQPLQLGTVRENIDQWRLDDVVNKSFTIEGGFRFRHRLRGPGASNDNGQLHSTEYHEGYAGLTYTSPYIKQIRSLLILNVTGITANHDPSPNALAALPPGQDVGHKREYGASQSATLVIPLEPRSGVTLTGTYAHGQFEEDEDQPFPYAYNITEFSLIKSINPYVGVQIGYQDIWQERQGAPFPLPGVVHGAEFTTQVDLHLDFNRIFAKPKPAVPGST